MLVDLHIHTDATEGGLPAADVLKAAKAAGLDAVAVTERGVPADTKALEALAKEAGIAVFFGVEIETDRGRILAYPPKIDAAYAAETWGGDGGDFDQVVGSLADAGWAVVVAQPYDERYAPTPGDRVMELDGLHGVEVAVPGSGMLAHDLALEAALSRDVSAVGGSGAIDDLGAIGQCSTLFARPVASQKDLVGQLKSGEVWIAQKVASSSGEGGRSERDSGERRGPRGGGGGGGRRRRGPR
jgi:hypothetical protein